MTYFKFFVTAFLLLLLQSRLSAQGINLFQQNGLVGVKDYNTNKIIIPAEYSSIYKKTISISPLSYFWLIKQKGKFGMINSRGQLLLPLKYDAIEILKVGFAIISIADMKGVADTNGRVIIPAKYQNIHWSSKVESPKVFWTEKNDSSIVFNSEGNFLIKLPCHIQDCSKDGTVFIGNKKGYGTGAYDQWGNNFIPFSYGSLYIDREFILYIVKSNVEVFNMYGNKIISKQCLSVTTLPQKSFLLQNSYGKYLYFDSLGNRVIQDTVTSYTILENLTWLTVKKKDTTYSFSTNRNLTNGYESINECGEYLLVQKNKNWGAIDPDGKVVIPFIYSQLKKISTDPYLIIAKINNRQVIIDQNNKVIIPNQNNYSFINYYKDPESGKEIIIVENKFKYGAINLDNRIILPLKFDKINIIDDYRIEATLEKKKSCYNFTGKKTAVGSPLLGGMIYKEKIKGNFKDKTKPKSIMYDANGKELLKCYDYKVLNNFFLIISLEKNKNCGLMAADGKILIPFIYDKIDALKDDDYFRVKLKKKVGVIDRLNNIIIPIICREVNLWNDTLLYVKNPDNIAGMLDFSSKVRITFNYDKFYDRFSQFIIASKNKKWGIITTTESIAIPFEYTSITLLKNKLLVLKKENAYCLLPVTHSISEMKCFDKITFDNSGYYNQNEKVIVSLHEKSGLIGYDGKTILPIEYDKILNQCSYYVIINNHKFGLADLEGKIIIPAESDSIYCISNKICGVVRNKKYGIIKDSTIIIPIQYDSIKFIPGQNDQNSFYTLKKNKRYYFADNEGKVDTRYSYDHIARESDNFIKVILNGKVGLVNTKGEIALEPLYQDIYKIRGTNFYSTKRNTKMSIMSENLGKQTPFLYDTLYSIVKTSYFIIKQNQLYGVIDSDGNLITPVVYDAISRSKVPQTKFYQVKKNGKSGLLSETFQEKILCRYDTIFPVAKTNCFIIKQENRYGIIDSEGNLLMPAIYEAISDFRVFDNKFYIIKKDGKLGLLSETFAEQIHCLYDTLYPLSMTDFFVVKQGNFFGISDLTGHLILPVNYETITNSAEYYIEEMEINDANGDYDSPKQKNEIFNKEKKYIQTTASFFIVRKEKKYGILSSVDTILPVIYDDIEPFRSHYIITLDNKYGLCDSSGKITIPLIYKSIDNPGAVNAVIADNNDGTGVIDVDGEIIAPLIYDDVEYAERDDCFYASIRNKYGAFNSTGKTMAEFKYDDIDHEELKDYLIVESDDKKGLIRKKDGKIVAEPLYEDIYSLNDDNIIIITDKDEKCGLLNGNTGKMEVGIKYDDVSFDKKSKNYVFSKDNQPSKEWSYTIGKGLKAIK
jgi:hypothetical protein